MRTAAYARYSSDSQRDASLEDQLRNVRAYCSRQGWQDPVVYTDAAMSGSRNDRPGYRTMLAEASHFDVILVDDLSRLSRDSIEVAQTMKRLKFAGVRVVSVSDDMDTNSKGHKVNAGLRGLMSELYLDDLAEKTHRGLTGRALAGSCAGGLPFGYRVAGVGLRVIDEAQAAIVRRVFADYVAGHSPRDIASALNREGVRPARWKPGRTWCMTAIHGDLRRGIGMLANPIYIGHQVWNRSRWIKHPDSGRRIRKERPEAEWIVTEHPGLAIIDQATWEAAQSRLRGARVNGPGKCAGRAPRHLLSGLLRCASCGGPMVIVDRYRYGCSTHKDRGESACANRLKVAKGCAEPALLNGLKREMMDERTFREAERAAMVELRKLAPDIDAAKAAVQDAERKHRNIMNALREGIITPSTRAELVSTERELQVAQSALAGLQRQRPAQMIPRFRDLMRDKLVRLENVRNVVEARELMKELLGEKIVLREEGGELFAEIGTCQISMVAGAGSVLYRTEPLRIPIPRKPGRAS